MSSVALVGFLGAGNLGNDASLEVVLAWLANNRPDTRITVITSDPQSARSRYGVAALPLNLYPPLGPAGLLPKIRRGAGRIADVPRSALLPGRFDAVLVPGMGVFEDSLPIGPWGFPLTMALLAGACRVRRCPFLLLGIGAEKPVDARLERIFARTARWASHVSCRDERSAEVLARWVGTVPAVYPDLAFGHPGSADVAQGGPDAQRRIVVVGVMGGDWENAYSGSNPPRTDYLQAMSYVVSSILDRGHDVVVTGGDDADVAVAEALGRRVECLNLSAGRHLRVRTASTFTELSELFASADLVVASRYHNVVGALRVGVPTVAVSYAPKCADVMELWGQAGHVHDIRTLDGPALLDDGLALLENSERVRTGLRARAGRARSDVESLLNRTLGEAIAPLPSTPGSGHR